MCVCVLGVSVKLVGWSSVSHIWAHPTRRRSLYPNGGWRSGPRISRRQVSPLSVIIWPDIDGLLVHFLFLCTLTLSADQSAAVNAFFSPFQEEARVGHSEHPRHDAATWAPGNPQHRQRHRERRGSEWRQHGDSGWHCRRWGSGPHHPGPCPLLRGPRDFWGSLPERGPEPRGPHRLLLLRCTATAGTKGSDADARQRGWCPLRGRRDRLRISCRFQTTTST